MHTDNQIVNPEDAAPTGIVGKAQGLLGQGIQASVVAQTLGVSESYISQLLSQDAFLQRVVQLRYIALQAHTARDARYDKIEDELLERLEASLPMMFDPMKILRAIQTINGAKRRGSSETGSITQHNMVVNLTMPTAILERFAITKDANNQIVEAGEQKLVTIQSGSLMDRVNKLRQKQLEGSHDESTNQTGTPALGT